MKEKFKLYGSIFILAVFVPCLLTVWTDSRKAADPVQTQMEEELPFVVAKEISVTSEPECLKAQAVIARTNLWRQYQESLKETELSNEAKEAKNEISEISKEEIQVSGDGNNTIQDGENKDWQISDSGLASATEQELKEVWGEAAYESNMEKIRQAVEETGGEIVTFEGEPIQAAYYFAANCKTRNASEVPGQEEYIYLQCVDSEDDMLADGFLTVIYMEKQEFVNALAPIFLDETLVADEMPGALELTARDSADYVTEVTCGMTVANGEAVRDALHLNSACFWLSELDGKIRIVTKGIGHGLGLSQYGANTLAKQGKNYKEILNYYYTNVTITDW